MALNPWEYASKTNNEHPHQVALFMWFGMAEKFGRVAADDPLSYSKPGHALAAYGPMRGPASEPYRSTQWLHAIKNQGHGDAIRGNKSAAEGVKAGVPDMFLPVPRLAWSGYPMDLTHTNGMICGLYIELKRSDSVGKKAGSTDADQDRWHESLITAGYSVQVCYGWEAARDCVLNYLGIS